MAGGWGLHPRDHEHLRRELCDGVRAAAPERLPGPGVHAVHEVQRLPEPALDQPLSREPAL